MIFFMSAQNTLKLIVIYENVWFDRGEIFTCPKNHGSCELCLLRMNKIYLINNWNLKIIFLKITNLYYFLSH